MERSAKCAQALRTVLVVVREGTVAEFGGGFGRLVFFRGHFAVHACAADFFVEAIGTVARVGRVGLSGHWGWAERRVEVENWDTCWRNAEKEVNRWSGALCTISQRESHDA